MKTTIVIYSISLIATLVMISMILKLQIRNNKSKKLIEVVSTLNEKDAFFVSIDKYISEVKSEEFIAKANIVKLWGLIYYKKYDEVISQAKKINFFKILKRSKNGYSVELNEDSMYYYLLACPNSLYSENKTDLIKELSDIFSISNEIKDTLVYKIHTESLKFYLNTEDNGEEFFKEVLEGNYSGYDYSKGLIGLYKNIITALLCAAYARKKDIESIQLIKEDCLTFKKTIIGNRFINELKLNEFLKEE